jgi:hypothetical protein
MGKNIKYGNAGLLAAAFIFLAYASFTLTPASLKQNTDTMLAAVGVGVSASVPPNQYNTLAAQLSAKEVELNQREAQLNAEGYGSAPGTSGIVSIPADRYGFYSLWISAALFVLVALNFYYDVRRRRGASTGNFSVDLR